MRDGEHCSPPASRAMPPPIAISCRRSCRSCARWRGRGCQASREVHHPTAYETFADPQANQTGEASHSLARMMAELSPRQKEAVDLVKLREMSLAEASAASGQSIAS